MPKVYQKLVVHHYASLLVKNLVGMVMTAGD